MATDRPAESERAEQAGTRSATLTRAAWVGILANSLFVDTLHWRHLWLLAALIWAGWMRASYRPAGVVSSSATVRSRLSR